MLGPSIHPDRGPSRLLIVTPDRYENRTFSVKDRTVPSLAQVHAEPLVTSAETGVLDVTVALHRLAPSVKAQASIWPPIHL